MTQGCLAPSACPACPQDPYQLAQRRKHPHHPHLALPAPTPAPPPSTSINLVSSVVPCVACGFSNFCERPHLEHLSHSQPIVKKRKCTYSDILTIF
ncbi:hypothetical protein E2C01_077675 [Portunus trituberculatus]|uniref:Uncharacterized protein n=1 Tax=Portunus trituberculatus TaxID=210409 RepID=A0A5B7IMX8_PORTR|nr:hypothetical protein [Portunus trituberculatus]